MQAEHFVSYSQYVGDVDIHCVGFPGFHENILESARSQDDGITLLSELGFVSSLGLCTLSFSLLILLVLLQRTSGFRSSINQLFGVGQNELHVLVELHLPSVGDWLLLVISIKECLSDWHLHTLPCHFLKVNIAHSEHSPQRFSSLLELFEHRLIIVYS